MGFGDGISVFVRRYYRVCFEFRLVLGYEDIEGNAVVYILGGFIEFIFVVISSLFLVFRIVGNRSVVEVVSL